MSEFYDPAEGVPLGNPADDLPFTIRMQPPDTRERRYDPDTPRAIKLSDGAEPWVTWGYGNVWLTDADVADWPLQHFLPVLCAMQKLAPSAAPAAGPTALDGDMDVDVFRGGAV